MGFEVSDARRRVIRKLTERDWTPTDLAAELETSTEAVYNHLDDLEERGVLTTRKVAATTRPRTEYSIGRGFLQYVAVLPGQYRERATDLDDRKEAIVRIWNVPQERFHAPIERYWWALANHDAVDLADVTVVALFGSVARGDADGDSDVDVLLVAENEDAEERLRNEFGTRRIETDGESTIVVAEVYTKAEFEASLDVGSDFLQRIGNELHVVYDPDGFLRQGGRPE